MLLDGEMGVSLEEKSVLENLVRFCKALFHVSKLKRHEFVNVPFLAVFVDARLRSRESFFRIGDGRQDFIVDIDQIERFEGC